MANENLKSPLQTIRAHCLDCSGTSYEVEKCPCDKTCKLWPYRFGKDPRREKHILTDEQREKLRERLGKKRKPVDTGVEL